MENESEGNEKPPEIVTLILEKKRFEVEKQKLISKSQYFAALLSANYLEYHQTEHIINYDISPVSLQDFIDWIHNDEIITAATNCEEFDRVLILLHLSVLFATDKLVEDITDRLERHYMSPRYVITIWLLAQELNINILRDLSLVVCLDHFNKLPVSSIYELSKENFLKLIGNINIKSTESYLLNVAREWMNHHKDSTIPLDIVKNKETKILHSIISCESSDIINSEQFIHCWDGTDFFELTSFKYPKDITDRSTGKNILKGMQITGRGYNLYLCGGEYGIGSGKFNKNVWRYSLISKKWSLETVMPVERRTMIAVFLKNKLMLVGGVGRYRQKLQSIDIYDIDTGVWTSGKEMDWEFTTVPEHYIFDESLVILKKKSQPDEKIWETEDSITQNHKELFAQEGVPILVPKTLPCYIHTRSNDKMILRAIIETCNLERCIYAQSTIPITFQDDYNPDDTMLKFHFIRIFSNSTSYNNYGYDNCGLSALPCTGPKIFTLGGMCHVHNIPIQNTNKFRSFSFSHSPKRFFNLAHPAHLHTTNLNHI